MWENVAKEFKHGRFPTKQGGSIMYGFNTFLIYAWFFVKLFLHIICELWLWEVQLNMVGEMGLLILPCLSVTRAKFA